MVLSFISCAKKETTKAKLVVSFAAAQTNQFDGSVIIMGKHNETGAKFLHKVEGAGFEQDLQNGTWNFAIIGWHGATTGVNKNFRGKAYCDTIPNLELTGGDVDLSFNATVSNCSRSFFGAESAEAINGFIPLKGHSCYSVDRFIAANGNFAKDHLGVCNDTAPSIKTNATHFRLAIKRLNLDGSFGSLIPGECIDMTNPGTDEFYRVPKGSTEFDFTYEIVTYSDAACSTQVKTYPFSQSFRSKSTGENKAGVIIDGTTNEFIALFNESACYNSGGVMERVPDLRATIPSTIEVVCKPSQLPTGDGIQAGDSIDYILAHDLQMPNSPNDSAYNTGQMFKGNLYGNRHVLRSGNRALFNEIMADSTNSAKPTTFQDFILSDFQISTTTALQKYGALSNSLKIPSGNYFKVQNVKVESIDSSILNIYSNNMSSYMGSVFGEIKNDADFSPTDPPTFLMEGVTSNITLESTGSIGGLIGTLFGKGVIKRSGFSGSLDTRQNTNSSLSVIADLNHISGIVANIEKVITPALVLSGLLLEEVASRPKILKVHPTINNTIISGIIGKMSSPDSTFPIKLNASYFIAPSSLDQDFAGVFGSTLSDAGTAYNFNTDVVFNGLYLGGTPQTTDYNILTMNYFNPIATLPDIIGTLDIFYANNYTGDLIDFYLELSGSLSPISNGTQLTSTDFRIEKNNLYSVTDNSDKWVTNPELVGNAEVKLTWELEQP
jgi:hypothetical protein